MKIITIISVSIISEASFLPTLYSIVYNHTENTFIKVKENISKEFLQEIVSNIKVVEEIDFSKSEIISYVSNEEIKEAYNLLVEKDKLGKGLRYKVSKLNQIEKEALELLKELNF